MASDAYWFKHDSNASRDLKLQKLRRIYDYWGIGVYWSVLENLRESNGYKWESDASSMQFLAELLRVEESKFNSFILDCFRLELFVNKGGYFYSKSLINRMVKWESAKENGKKGGLKVRLNPNTKGSIEVSVKPKSNHKKRREEIREDILGDDVIFISKFNEIKNSKFQLTDKVKSSLRERLKTYTLEQIETAVRNCKADKYHIENPKYLTPEFILRPDKLEMYLNVKPKEFTTNPHFFTSQIQ